ncbi:MAG: DUF2240 family protein [Archaeoglobaceae archaeon]
MFELENAVIIEESLIDRLVGEISKKTGKSFQEIFSMISEKQEKMSNIVSFEVAALVVAKELGLNIAEYLEAVENRIFNEAAE